MNRIKHIKKRTINKSFTQIFFDKGGLVMISSFLTLLVSSLLNLYFFNTNIEERNRLEQLKLNEMSAEYEKKYRLGLIEDFGLDYQMFFRKHVEQIFNNFYNQYVLGHETSNTPNDLYTLVEDLDIVAWPLIKDESVLDLGTVQVDPKEEIFSKYFDMRLIDQETDIDLFDNHIRDIRIFIVIVQSYMVNSNLGIYDSDDLLNESQENIIHYYHRLGNQKRVILERILKKESSLLKM